MLCVVCFVVLGTGVLCIVLPTALLISLVGSGFRQGSGFRVLQSSGFRSVVVGGCGLFTFLHTTTRRKGNGSISFSKKAIFSFII